MDVKFGEGRTKYGPGISIELTGDDVAMAIDAYIVAHGVHVRGPRTITVNGELCERGNIYVDPSGFVIADGEKFSGRGPADEAIPMPEIPLTEQTAAVEWGERECQHLSELRSAAGQRVFAALYGDRAAALRAAADTLRGLMEGGDG
jgi:hypothetical protein